MCRIPQCGSMFRSVVISLDALIRWPSAPPSNVKEIFLTYRNVQGQERVKALQQIGWQNLAFRKLFSDPMPKPRRRLRRAIWSTALRLELDVMNRIVAAPPEEPTLPLGVDFSHRLAVRAIYAACRASDMHA